MKQDIRKAFDTVRCQDGLKERTRSHVLGRMRQRQPKPAMHRMKLIVSLACLLVFAGSGFGGYQLYYAEAATISIDVNPSIELGINRWGRVIEEVPYGRDGETVLREVSLRHLEYEEALERLIGSEAMQDYLKKDALLSITLENRGSSDLLLENLCGHHPQAVSQPGQDRICQRGRPHVPGSPQPWHVRGKILCHTGTAHRRPTGHPG